MKFEGIKIATTSKYVWDFVSKSWIIIRQSKMTVIICATYRRTDIKILKELSIVDKTFRFFMMVSEVFKMKRVFKD